jgi:quercetin dioxygenase-like cupin family protein
MKLTSLHTNDKTVSALGLFQGQTGKTTALRIATEGILKEHSSTVPAILMCILGEARYEQSDGMSTLLTPGDYVEIAPDVKHQVIGLTETHLLLLK